MVPQAVEWDSPHQQGHQAMGSRCNHLPLQYIIVRQHYLRKGDDANYWRELHLPRRSGRQNTPPRLAQLLKQMQASGRQKMQVSLDHMEQRKVRASRYQPVCTCGFYVWVAALQASCKGVARQLSMYPVHSLDLTPLPSRGLAGWQRCHQSPEAHAEQHGGQDGASQLQGGAHL
jgi:hypothetical protein